MAPRVYVTYALPVLLALVVLFVFPVTKHIRRDVDRWKYWALQAVTFVGAMVGLERSILPAIAEQEFHLAARTALLSFIVVFGVAKALTNYGAGRASDRLGRKHVLVGGWLVALPVPFLLMWAPSWNWVLVANVFLGVSQGLTWSTTVIMKIDLVGPRQRGLAMGLNEFAGYAALAGSALATGWIAARYGLRPQPFYLGVVFALVGLALSALLVRETRHHASHESTLVGTVRDDHGLTVFGVASALARQRVWRGSAGYLPAPGVPLHSEAVDHLIATARAGGSEAPLYVLALGCVTNIASALLLAPDLVDRIVVVWTSGYPSHAPHVNHSFNLEQDLWASQLLLDSGVPHVYLPGYHVGAQLRLSLAEMDRHVRGRGALGDYLWQLFTHNPLWPILGVDPATANQQPHSWVIWDLICVAWLLQPDWVPSTLVRAPRLGADRRWQAEESRHLMREAHGVQRDAIMSDFLSRLPTTGL